MADADRRDQLQRELFLSVLMLTRPSVAMTRRLAQAMRELRVAAGQVLYEKGEPAEDIYFVAEGTITTDDDGAAPLSFGVGDIVGITDVNLDRPRARRAVVSSDALLLHLRFDDWLSVQEGNDEWARETRRVVGAMVHDALCASAPAFDPQAHASDAASRFDGTIVQRIVALHGSPFFDRAGIQAVAALAERAEVVRFARDSIVFARATETRAVHLVVRGAVVASRLGPPPVTLGFGAGELVLAGGAFSHALSDYEVRAVHDGTLLSLRWSDLDDVVEDHASLSRSLLRGITLSRERWQAAARQTDPPKP